MFNKVLGFIVAVIAVTITQCGPNSRSDDGTDSTLKFQSEKRLLISVIKQLDLMFAEDSAANGKNYPHVLFLLRKQIAEQLHNQQQDNKIDIYGQDHKFLAIQEDTINLLLDQGEKDLAHLMQRITSHPDQRLTDPDGMRVLIANKDKLFSEIEKLKSDYKENSGVFSHEDPSEETYSFIFENLVRLQENLKGETR